MQNKKPSYIILLSGGLDSVVNLHEACKVGDVDLALTFNYGQISAKQELKAARFFCENLNIKNVAIDLPWLKDLTSTALVNSKVDMPSLKNLDDFTEATASAKNVWVPNRNGVFINIAASFAESLGADYIVPGFNKEEAVTFSDNSQDFLDRCNKALALSTMSQVKVTCFTTDLDKTGMMRRASELGVDLDRVWSCYLGEETKCGRCESCQRFNRASKAIGRR